MQEVGLENLAALKGELNDKEAEIAKLTNSNSADVENLEKQYDGLKEDYDKKQFEMAALEDNLKASATEKAKLNAEHGDQLKALERNYKNLKNTYDDGRDEIAKMSSDLEGTEDRLRKAEDELARVQATLADASGDLKRSVELAQRRKDLAKRIQDNFKDHGVIAEVDDDTGDVILDFGEDYFDTDSHELKLGMERTIRKAIPVYAESLFGSEVLASLISSVEIIGFASPTYGGKPVNPTGLSIDDRTAGTYNLDLSYQRARSIFEYVFNTDKIRFDYQNTMVPLINVTGRSFFTEKVDPDTTGDLSLDEFCEQYNCKKSQRVIIKFGLELKGKSS
jgi:outer membrane protein OmpA-like peptidoglycan-associated protein